MRRQGKGKSGGGISALKNNLLPLDLQYLYQNEYLDYIKMLVILSKFKRRKKGINIEELNYYYTMLDLVELNQKREYEVNYEYYQDHYLINEEALRKYSIILKNQNLIDINVENTNKETLLYLKLSESGMNLVEGLEDKYFEKLVDKYNLINSTKKYSLANHRKVLSRDEK